MKFKKAERKHGKRIDIVLLAALLTLNIMPKTVFSYNYEQYVAGDEWNYIDKGDHAIICGYRGMEEKVTIPSEIDGKTVTELCYGDDVNQEYFHPELYQSEFFQSYYDPAAIGYYYVTREITIPDTVKKIGQYTFNNSTSLEKVNLPEGLEIIEKCAFSGCENLTEINIPSTAERIEDQAFQKTAIRELVIPEGVRYIGDMAFAYSGVTSAQFADSVSYMGMGVFLNCSSLAEIKLPRGLTKISSYMFAACSMLNRVEIPDSVRIIEKNAFGSSGLTSIELPKGLTEIPASLFNGCKNLTSVEIPEGVWGIGQDAFGYCEALEEVHFPKSLKSAVNIFRNNPSLKKVVFELDRETLTAVMGEDPFENMIMLDYIKDHSSVQIIYGEKDTAADPEPEPEPVPEEKTAAEKTRELLTITSIIFAALLLIAECMLIIQKAAQKPKRAEQAGNLLTKYSSDTVICPHCGAGEGRGSVYCTNCGKKLPKKKPKN